MPLAVRYVEPKHLCRRPLPEGTRNELQTVAALSLVSVIQQIGSLAKHAESMMGDLCDTMSQYCQRSLKLQERVTHLKKKVLPRLEFQIQEEADRNIEVYLDCEHYSSDHTISQQLLSISTAPDSLREQYKSSGEIPPLYQFTQHWDNGQNAVHLYSNPQYFFNSWREDMEKKSAITSSRRRSQLQQQNSEMMLEELMEVSLPVQTNKKRNNTKPDTSYSATLPLRVKPRKKANKPHLQHAFNSMKRESQKERKALTSETFTATTPTTNGASQEHSESSGYMSQHSSSTSLDTPNGESGSLKKRSYSTQYVHNNDEKGGESKGGQPRVLNRTISSTSISRKSSGSKVNEQQQHSPHSIRGTSSDTPSTPPLTTPILSTPPGSSKVSPTALKKRQSTNIGEKGIMFKLGGEEEGEKSSVPKSPLKQGPRSPTKTSPLHTATVSPEIRHKTVNIIRSLSQNSPAPEGVRNSGIFSFPDPIETLRNNPYLSVNSSFSLDEILSTDDLLSAGSSQDSLKRRIAYGNYFNYSPIRPAPSPPAGVSPRRHHSVSTTSLDIRPLKKTSHESSNEGSPIAERRASQLSTPRRKAPPPPSVGSSKNTSPLGGSPRMTRNLSQGSETIQPLRPLSGIEQITEGHQKVTKKLSKDLPSSGGGNNDNSFYSNQVKKSPEFKRSSHPLSTQGFYGNQFEERCYSNPSKMEERRHSNTAKTQQPEPHPQSNIEDRSHSNPKSEDRRHSNPKPENRRHSNPKPEDHRHGNPKSEERRPSNPKPEQCHPSNSAKTGKQPLEEIPIKAPNETPPISTQSPPSSAGKKFKGFFTRQSSQEILKQLPTTNNSTSSVTSGKPTTTNSTNISTNTTGNKSSTTINNVTGNKSSTATNNATGNKSTSGGNKKSTQHILKAGGVEKAVVSAERTKLLSAIRKGIELKRVQERQRANSSSGNDSIMPWDVAAILERRQALENSDNELDDDMVQENEWEDI